MQAVSPSFHTFIRSVDAQPGDRIPTPFALYEITSHRLLVHFIDYKTYRAQQVETGFVKECFQKAASAGFRIITIWEDVWFHHEELVSARILAMLGQRQRVHARETSVIRLDKEQASAFLDAHHLQGSTSAYYKYGLTWKGGLVAVATFSKARVMHDGPVYYRSYELERFASEAGMTVVGGLGKLLKHFIATHHARHIMTYADADWGSGESYEKLGFRKQQQGPPREFVIDTGTLTRRYLHHTGLTGEQLMEKGLLKIGNSGSVKLLLDLQKA